MRTAVITLVHGRHDHLQLQLAGLLQSAATFQRYVVVALDDPGARELIEPVVAGKSFDTQILEVSAGPELPLALARNVGAAAAIQAGAHLLIFLDVDCIPDINLVGTYQQAANRHPDELLCGPVAYLPPPGPAGYDLAGIDRLALPHQARPAPAAGEVVAAADSRLFWSLSFAVTAQTWRRIGGFCTDYVGYGGEDTDFAQQAQRVGVGLSWVGGATAYHQYHPVSRPPVEHLAAIVRNARIFHARWNWWPMSGWLKEFASRGLLVETEDDWLMAP